MNHTLKSGRALEIRKAEESDAHALVQYMEDISAETDCLSFGSGEFGITPEEEIEFIKSFQSGAGKVFLLGLVEGRIVASLSFNNGKRKRLEHYGEFGMSVRREFWGDGIGAILVDSLIDWAKENRIVTKINLMVRHDNVRAINLYLKKGFSFEGKIPRGIRIKGEYHDVYTMGLCL
jgi:RimJ/RimL family protein N-acetyltransferase